MIFVRHQRIERITLEGRKAAAFRRRQNRELQKYPLFAAEIASGLPSIEQAEVERNLRAESAEQRRRDFDARVWKESRRDYFASDEETRQAIRRMWTGWAGPKTPLYFRYVVDRCSGEFDRRAAASKVRDLAVRAKVRTSAGFQQSLRLEAA